MSGKGTKWRHDFFEKVETIRLVDPLSYFLGSQDAGEVVEFTYGDAVKMAGHSCPSVAGAYKVTALALGALYGDEAPVRGDIRVLIKGSSDHLAYGPQSQVITLITGAATETGFKGLKGKFSRKALLVFDKDDFQFNTFIFERSDTGKAVRITYNPDKVSGDPEESKEMGRLMGLALSGEATEEEHERFRELWQGTVEKILVNGESYADLFVVTEEEGFEFPGSNH